MIILFGPAGSGKSTQGQKLAETYGRRWLSVGQVLRDSGEFDETLKEGNLVDDATVVRLMDEQIAAAEAEGLEMILDGYPRNLKQTEIMLDAGSAFFGKIEGAVVLKVPVDELWRRIELRGRADDTKAALEKRLAIYERNIEGILGLLREQGVPVCEIDGVGTPEEITERIKKACEAGMLI